MSLLSCDWFLMNNISAWEKRDEWNFSHNTYFLENAIKIIVMSFAQTRKNLTRALLILQYMHASRGSIYDLNARMQELISRLTINYFLAGLCVTICFANCVWLKWESQAASYRSRSLWCAAHLPRSKLLLKIFHRDVARSESGEQSKDGHLPSIAIVDCVLRLRVPTSFIYRLRMRVAATSADKDRVTLTRAQSRPQSCEAAVSQSTRDHLVRLTYW